jgi:hypothetical protein
MALLLSYFFNFYASEFRWGTEVVAVHLGRRTATWDVDHMNLRGRRLQRLHVADPFLTDRNLNCVLSTEQENTLYNEICKAAVALQNGQLPAGLEQTDGATGDDGSSPRDQYHEDQYHEDADAGTAPDLKPTTPLASVASAPAWNGRTPLPPAPAKPKPAPPAPPAAKTKVSVEPAAEPSSKLPAKPPVEPTDKPPPDKATPAPKAAMIRQLAELGMHLTKEQQHRVLANHPESNEPPLRVAPGIGLDMVGLVPGPGGSERAPAAAQHTAGHEVLPSGIGLHIYSGNDPWAEHPRDIEMADDEVPPSWGPPCWGGPIPPMQPTRSERKAMEKRRLDEFSKRTALQNGWEETATATLQSRLADVQQAPLSASSYASSAAQQQRAPRAVGSGLGRPEEAVGTQPSGSRQPLPRVAHEGYSSGFVAARPYGEQGHGFAAGAPDRDETRRGGLAGANGVSRMPPPNHRAAAGAGAGLGGWQSTTATPFDAWLGVDAPEPADIPLTRLGDMHFRF